MSAHAVAEKHADHIVCICGAHLPTEAPTRYHRRRAFWRHTDQETA